MRCSCNREDNILSNTCVAKVPIFSKLSAKELMEIAKVTTDKKFQKGEIIFLPGDTIDKLYVIHEGGVKISRISESGKEQIIRILGPGDFMGELALFAPRLSQNSAEALEETVVCEIESKKIKELMLQSSQIALKILEEVTQRLEKAENLVESIGLYDVEKRIATILLELAKDNDEMVLPMSKKDLAAHIGTTQETLSRKLTFFQDQGLIELVGQRKIIILNREGLSFWDIKNQ